MGNINISLHDCNKFEQLTSQSSRNLAVRVGDYKRSEQDPDEVDIEVSDLILHEGYDPWTIQYDICIVSLSSEANLSSDAIGIISLPPEQPEYEDDTNCIVSGWGLTGLDSTYPNILQKVNISQHNFIYYFP